jgi:hypothetical protein
MEILRIIQAGPYNKFDHFLTEDTSSGLAAGIITHNHIISEHH